MGVRYVFIHKVQLLRAGNNQPTKQVGKHRDCQPENVRGLYVKNTLSISTRYITIWTCVTVNYRCLPSFPLSNVQAYFHTFSSMSTNENVRGTLDTFKKRKKKQWYHRHRKQEKPHTHSNSLTER